MVIETIILIAVLAFLAELLDSSLGMMYGTILSPLLIIMGYDPFVVVPSILLSQAGGGLVASIFHHKYSNADFKPKIVNFKKIKSKIKEIGLMESFKRGFSKDFKIAFVISTLGVIATILAVLLAVNLPKSFIKIYIGILVLIMGVILLSRVKFRFTWRRMIGVGLISSFNKGLSGGGFGPIVTSGQIIAGNNPKGAIAATTLAEAPICLVGFLTYMLTKGFSSWYFLLALSVGAIIAAPLGALLTSKMNERKLRPVLGILALVLGIWTLTKVFLK